MERQRVVAHHQRAPGDHGGDGPEVQTARPADGAARRVPELTALEDSFRETLATRVRLVGNEHRGRIEIAYTSREDQERITEILVSKR